MKERDIIEAAIKVLAQKGVSATVSEIAAEAGVLENVIYKSGFSKDSILLAIYDEFWGKIIKEASAITDPKWPVNSIEKLKSLVIVSMQFIIREVSLIQVIAKCNLQYPEAYKEPELQEKRLEIRRKNREFLTVVDNIIKIGQEANEIRKEGLKPQVIRQILMGSFLLVNYGLFIQFATNESVGYEGQDAKDGLFFLVDSFKK